MLAKPRLVEPSLQSPFYTLQELPVRFANKFRCGGWGAI